MFFNKYGRIKELQHKFDIFGYPKDPFNDANFNELGILLHGKKEWARRKISMSGLKKTIGRKEE